MLHVVVCVAGLLVLAAGIFDIVVKLVRNFLKGTKAVAERRKCDSSKFSARRVGRRRTQESNMCYYPRLVRSERLPSDRAGDPKCNLCPKQGLRMCDRKLLLRGAPGKWVAGMRGDFACALN